MKSRTSLGRKKPRERRKLRRKNRRAIGIWYPGVGYFRLMEA